MFRGCTLFLCCLAAAAGATNAPPISYDQVEVARTKTSIYVGTVSLAMPAFSRTSGGFESSYVAKVFPYSFLNEAGTLRVEVSDAQLEQLARGERIDFTGRAVRADGEERRVTGQATPDDAASGKLKVRVFVSKRVELIFNSTYRFRDV
jgi:hypothetical protein